MRGQPGTKEKEKYLQNQVKGMWHEGRESHDRQLRDLQGEAALLVSIKYLLNKKLCDS
jgi:hypothetical protein